jgi:undecaprenyl-diphosphatase
MQTFIFGFAPTVVPCASFDGIVSHWFMARQSHEMVEWMQGISATASGMTVGISLGVALVALAFMRKWLKMIVLTLVVPGGALMGEGIKLLVQRQRPLLVGPFVDWAGYSFPSGHTMCATLVYGGLALWLWRRIESRWWRSVIAAGAGVMILLVGLSRVALGAHYVTDCLAAVVIGAVWLGVCRFGFKRVQRVLARVPAEQSNPNS